jgi:hypothetical protein
VFRHTSDIVLDRSHLLKRPGRVESQEFSEFAAVLGVLVNTELNVLAERLVKLVEIVLVFRDLAEKVEGLLDEVLANDLEDLVLLQGFSRDIERKIFRVDNTLDEVEILGNEIFTIVHDEHAADVKFDIIALLLRLKEVKGSALRDEDNGFEFELTLD